MRPILIAISLLVAVTTSAQKKSKTEKDFEKISDKIYPVIKVSELGEEGADSQYDAGEDPVFRKVAGDLLCFYGVDRDTHFELLLESQIPDGVGTDELDEYAHDNLLAFVNEQLMIHQTAFGGIGFSCGGDHEAALLTLPEIWDVITERLGEEIIFAVPAKDLIIFVSAEDEQGIFELEDLVTSIHESGERLLSRKLFVYIDGEIVASE